MATLTEPPPLFGREPDIAALLKRATRPGLTAVTARAQMGKSALLDAIVTRLLHQPTSLLVGSAKSSGETSDLLLRSVSDLYTRWIASSSFTEQARVVALQHNHDIIGRVGKATGSLFKALAGKPLDSIADLVKGMFDGLADANIQLRTGITLPRLKVDDARDLLTIVYRITGRPIVLILDQLDESPNPDLEIATLRTFLRQIDEWPPCHFLLGVLSRSEAADGLSLLAQAFDPIARWYDLPPMHLDDPDAAALLLTYLHARVLITGTVPDDDLLNLIDGYPGTVFRWVRNETFDPIPDLARLALLAGEANAYRFPEFNDLWPRLSPPAQTLAIRLSLLPSTATAEGWPMLRSIAVAAQPMSLLDELLQKHILENSLPPSFGHGKRADALRSWILQNARHDLIQTATAILPGLCALAHPSLPTFTVAATSIVFQRDLARQLSLSPVHQAVCEAAGTFIGADVIEADRLVNFEPDPSPATIPPEVATLLGYGLSNTCIMLGNQIAADPSETEIEATHATLDAVANELIQLSDGFPGDLILRETLAVSLYDAATVMVERGLFDEAVSYLFIIQERYRAHPDEDKLLDNLAKGSFNLLNTIARTEGMPPADLYLGLVRTLFEERPEHGVTRECYAEGLVEAMAQAHRLNLPSLLDQHRETLDDLCNAYADDPLVGCAYARSLTNFLEWSVTDPAMNRAAFIAEVEKIPTRFPRYPELQTLVENPLVS